MPTTLDVDKEVVKRLKAKHHFYGSWSAVAEDVGINRGVLCAVANEKRKASAAVLHALGLPLRHVTVAPLACGCPPTGKRCPVHQPKSTRRTDPVVRWNRVEPFALRALACLHDGEVARSMCGHYRLALRHDLDAVTG